MGKRLLYSKFLMAFCLLATVFADAQTVTIPAANTNGTGSTTAGRRQPFATYFGYERSAMIYSAGEIGTTGTIGSIAYYVASAPATPAAAPVKIYMKQTTSASFGAATSVATEETGATLVYDATIPGAAYVANSWLTLNLSTPFTYSGGTNNLEVIVEVNYGGGGSGEGSTAKTFRYNNTSTPNYYFQLWEADNTAPTGSGTLNYYRPNVQLGFQQPIDVTVTSLVAPGTMLSCYGPNQTVTVNVKNNGSSDLDLSVTPVTVGAVITGPNATSLTPVVLNSGLMPAGSAQNVTLTTTYDMSLSGTYGFRGYATVAGDGAPGNDTMASVSRAVSRVATFPHIVGFDATPNPPFLIQQVAGTGNWTIQTTGSMSYPTLTPVSDPGYAFFNSFTSSFQGAVSRLVTPCYDMTGLTHPGIDIYMSQDDVYDTNDDRVDVVVSTDGGATWSASLQTLHEYNAAYTTPGWKKYTIPLTGYANNSSVRIGLLATSAYGNNIGIDRIQVYDIPPVDLAPTALVSPLSSTCHSATDNIVVTVANNGGADVDFSVTPMTLSADITGASTQTVTTTVNTGTLAAGASANYTIGTGDFTAQGTHNFILAATVSGDANVGNDSLNASVLVGDISAFPSLETFDGAHAGWTISQISGTGNWAYQTGSMANPTLAPYSDSVKVYFNSYSFSAGAVSRLASPCINLTGLTHPVLSYYQSQDDAYPARADRINIRVSTDGGTTWSAVLDSSRIYNSNYSTPGWKKFSVCLDAYAGMANIKVAFDAVSAFGNNIGLEDVSISESTLPIAGTITAPSAVCSGTPAVLTLAGYTGSIQWQGSSNGTTFSNVSGATTDTFNTNALTVDTFFRALVSNPQGCPLPDSTLAASITINALPAVDLGADVAQCGGSVTLDAGAGATDYAWSTTETTQTISVSTTADYSVTVTGSNGCTAADTVNVNFNGIAPISLGNDTTICTGSSVTLDAGNTGTTYAWSTTETTNTISVNTAGTYSVTVSDANGCSTTDAIDIAISAPTVDLGGDDSLCTGATATLDAGNAGATYLWSTTETTQTIDVTTSNDYSVTITNSFGCSASDMAHVEFITVSDPVTTDATRCGTGPVTLSATGAGTLSWYADTTTYTLVNTGSTYTYVASATDTFYVMASNGGLDTFPTTFASGNGADGNMFEITALNDLTVTGFDAHITTDASFEIWYRPDAYLSVSGANTSSTGWTLLGSAANVPNAGFGNPTPLPINLSIFIPAGQTYSFYVTTTDFSTVEYTDGTSLGSVYSQNADLQFLEGHGGGYFDVTNQPRIFNGQIHYSTGCHSNPVPVIATVTPAPAITLSASSAILCQGNSDTLIVSSTDPTYTYSWTPAGSLSSPVGDTVIATPATATTYYVNAINGVGCANSASVSISVAPVVAPLVSASSPGVCPGGTDTLTILNPAEADLQNTTTVGIPDDDPAGVSSVIRSNYYSTIDANTIVSVCLNITHTWDGDLTITLISPSGTQLVLSDQNGFLDDDYTGTCFTSTAASDITTGTAPFTGSFLPQGAGGLSVFNGEPANGNWTLLVVDGASGDVGTLNDWSISFAGGVHSYSWTSTPSGFTASGTSATVSPTTSTDYVVTWTNSVTGCSATSQPVTVVINTPPVVEVNDTTTCAGTSVTLDAGNTGSTFSWSNGDATQTSAVTNAGTYYVTVTDANGCTATDSSTVMVNTLPVVNLGADTAQCGGSITLDAGNAGLAFAWSTTETTQTVDVSATGSYDVVVTDANNCSASDTIDVTINTLPVVDLGADTAACTGSSVTLDAGNAGATYAWSTTETTQTVDVSAAGSYNVVVTDANNCTATDSVDVTLNAVPVVNLGADVTQCGGSVTLDAANQGSAFVWSTTETTQTVSVSATGSYNVVVTDANNCTATDTVAVTINTPPTATFTLATDTFCTSAPSVTLTGGSPAGGTYYGTGVSGGSFNPATATVGNNTVYYAYTDNNGCSDTASDVAFVKVCVGINELGASSVSLYPNPANSFVTLKVDGLSGRLDVMVYDVQGRIVASFNEDIMPAVYQHNIDLSRFSAGTYTVSVKSETGTANYKLIVQK